MGVYACVWERAGVCVCVINKNFNLIILPAQQAIYILNLTYTLYQFIFENQKKIILKQN